MNTKRLFSPYTPNNTHPGFSVDCVILSFYKKKIRILLNQLGLNNYWQLPGGFMLNNESADEAAGRILTARTGLKGIYLKQFHLFSDPQRTMIEQNIELIAKGLNKDAHLIEEKNGYLQRSVSLGYYALVRYDDIQLFKTEEIETDWFEIDNLPYLYSDHEDIIKTSLKTIRSMLPAIPIGRKILPEKFTMSELRMMYEIILGKKLDRRNFQRKVLTSGLVIQLDETKSTSTYNPPNLYTFDKKTENILYHPFGTLK